jgi:hypothetical protein
VSGSKRKRICVVTAGHLSTCPRMLKAADALYEEGYEVRVVSARYSEWAWQADQDVRRTRSWRWQVVNYDRQYGRPGYLRSGARFRAAQYLARMAGPNRLPVALAAMAYGRAHSELVQAISAEPADLIYGGTAGALAATALAGARSGVPYGLDLEDFYSACHGSGASGQRVNALAESIERATLPRAAFMTAGSKAIAECYRRKYGITAVPLHNTCPLPVGAPESEPSPTSGLRLYWFGQTIGVDKGLELVVRAMGLARVPGELNLRGRAVPGYIESLEKLAMEAAPRLRIVLHGPAPPGLMVELCRPYDVGLACEPGLAGNNEVALSNKSLTYPLAGLGVAISDTPGQHDLAADLGEGAAVYRPNDVDALAAGLKRWSDDKSLLARAKAAAWDAARRRWHWEHPEERGALLRAVAGVFQ